MSDTWVRFEQVTKRYGAVTALDGMDFTLGRGEATALLGANGAGKTTAVRLMLGLAHPTSGVARLFERSPHDRAARQRVGVMLQVARVPETLTIAEHLHLCSSYYPSPMAISDVLSASGLSEFAHQRVGTLSGGQRQRLMFGLALCGNPDLLVLDEPTVGLDVESRRAFWRQIRRLMAEGRSLLLTTHYLEEADALAGRIVVLQRGRIIADGSPDAIKARGAGRRIRCTTRLSDEALRAIPGVRAVGHDEDCVCLVVVDAESAARVLLASDPALSRLEITSASLEDAFLSLTGSPATPPAHEVM